MNQSKFELPSRSGLLASLMDRVHLSNYRRSINGYSTATSEVGSYFKKRLQRRVKADESSISPITNASQGQVATLITLRLPLYGKVF